jgi:hypothetical protein
MALLAWRQDGRVRRKAVFLIAAQQAARTASAFVYASGHTKPGGRSAPAHPSGRVPFEWPTTGTVIPQHMVGGDQQSKVGEHARDQCNVRRRIVDLLPLRALLRRRGARAASRAAQHRQSGPPGTCGLARRFGVGHPAAAKELHAGWSIVVRVEQVAFWVRELIDLTLLAHLWPRQRRPARTRCLASWVGTSWTKWQ